MKYTLRKGASCVLLITILFLLQSVPPLRAQQADTSYTGPEVRVTATRINKPDYRQPVQVNVVDSLPLRFLSNQNLGLVLQSVTTAFVQDNGPGGLATISQRGFSARQTQVIWNGFELNHSMLGLTDLSIIPSSTIGSIEISPGNAGTSFGSGGAGGTVILHTKKLKNSVRLSNEVGSFGADQQTVGAGWNNDRWNLSAIVFHRHAANDFSYFDPFQNKEQKRIHNGLDARHVLAQAGWKKGHYQVKSALWYAGEANNIPGSIVSSSDAGRQKDRFIRWYAEAATWRGSTKFGLKTFYNLYKLDFANPEQRVNSESTVYNEVIRGSVNHYFSHQLDLHDLSSVEYDRVHTNNYRNGKNRITWSNLLQLNYNPWSRLWLYGAGRYDHYSDFGDALIPSVGLNFEVLKDHLYIRGTFKKDYTAPTFNDLYWANGGNPDLKPERSTTIEAGFVYRMKVHHLSFKISPEVYRSRQHNGIRWVPFSGGTTPVNIQESEMKGLELSTQADYNTNNWNISLHYLLTLTQARILSNPKSSSQVLDKQMRYVPPISQKLFLGISYRHLQIFVNRTGIGKRYTTNDHSSPLDPLPPYSVWNAGGGYQQPVGPLNLEVNVTVYNVFNKDYQVIAWYPMPGRNYQLTASISYPFK